VTDIADAARRFLAGRPLRTEPQDRPVLPKRIALPVFASDALSSVAYAPDEILLTLAFAGLAAVTISPWVALAVVVVLVTVIASYRQNVHAYPSGAGDYEVATENLGRKAGLAVASALLVDYVLTVAVSISAASQYAAAAIPALRGFEVQGAVAVVVLLAIANLRGLRATGPALTIPAYLFMAAIGTLAVAGFIQHLAGTLGQADSAALTIVPRSGFEEGLTGLAGAFLVMRAFSHGCAALTGVEAVSRGVPSFARPRSRNAATTLLLLGAILATMMMSVVALARLTGVKVVESPARDLLRDGQPVGAEYHQDPVIGQLAATVFRDAPALTLLVTAVTALVLVVAANTAFTGFPGFGSVLARDGFLPRQLHTRGDRLVYSNGIVSLSVAAITLIIAFDAEVTRLIHLYIVGVFISFTLSQLGMVRHWTRQLRHEYTREVRMRMQRSRLINTLGLAMTGAVLVVVLLARARHGAWIALAMMGILYLVMLTIHLHYERLTGELAVAGPQEARFLPVRTHAVVLVSRLHQPALRAIAYARATRPNTLEAVHAAVDDAEVAGLRRQWEELSVPVPLTVLAAPHHEITGPIVEYIRGLRRSSPRDLVMVFVPEFVVSHWWEGFLHNQSTLRLRARLLFVPGVVMVSVPFQHDQVDLLDAPLTE
jgi:amino acid transporter